MSKTSKDPHIGVKPQVPRTRQLLDCSILETGTRMHIAASISTFALYVISPILEDYKDILTCCDDGNDVHILCDVLTGHRQDSNTPFGVPFLFKDYVYETSPAKSKKR